jgi:hypothetical protein
VNVTQTITVRDDTSESLSLGLAATALVDALSAPSYTFTNGTGASQIDLHWEKAGNSAVTLAAGASVTYTLSALADDIGRTVAFARVRRLSLRITAKTGGDYLTVGGAATNPWTAPWSGTVTVRDYLLDVAAGATAHVVSAGSSDQLKITNSGSNPLTFEVALSGASA